MASIWDAAMDELDERGVYKYEVYSPFYILSYATHVFNLYNQQSKIYWETGRLPNMRSHILFVAPPGWMKSFYMGVMGSNEYSIFNNTGVKIGTEQYMTEAGFVGTVQNLGGAPVPVDGAAKTYSDGIMVIDEFSAITKALQTQHSNQLDNQLLSALDHGHVTKRLGMGKIEFDTRLTLWAGVQPARFDLTSGMGRRLMYLVFIPSKLDNDALMEAQHRGRNSAPNIPKMEALWDSIRNFKDDVEKIQYVDFDDSVLKEYKKLGLYSFEGSYFDRLLIGYQLAMYGPEKNMSISMKDKTLRDLINRQKQWRTDIMNGIDHVQVMRIIELNGNTMTKTELVEEAAMYGLNAMQVFEMLEDMKRFNLIKYQKGTIELL